MTKIFVCEVFDCELFGNMHHSEDWQTDENLKAADSQRNWNSWPHLTAWWTRESPERFPKGLRDAWKNSSMKDEFSYRADSRNFCLSALGEVCWSCWQDGRHSGMWHNRNYLNSEQWMNTRVDWSQNLTKLKTQFLRINFRHFLFRYEKLFI